MTQTPFQFAILENMVTILNCSDIDVLQAARKCPLEGWSGIWFKENLPHLQGICKVIVIVYPM